MALRPLHFCEVLEEEHSALYGHEDWRVLPSDIVSTSDVLMRCREVFGAALFVPVEQEIGIEEQKVKLAAILTENFVDTTTLLADDPRLAGTLSVLVTQLAREGADDAEDLTDDNDPSQPYEPDRIRWRNRETLEAVLQGLLVHDRRTWYFEAQQIRGPRAVAARWREVFGPTCVWAQENAAVDPAERIGDIVCDLNRLVDGPILTSLPALRDVPKQERVQFSDDLEALRASNPTFAGEDLQHVNRRMLDEIFGNAVQSGPEARLAKQIEIIHANGNTSALCLSGGGIRSATFGLGVLQGLAKRNLLDKFDYISTVSGGGYIGGWLSSWSRRHPTGMRGVSSDLSAAPVDKLSPDPSPVRHLREFSNYLTPRVGALTGDTLTVVAIYVRNLLLNWVVLVPMLIAALLVPRLIFAIDFGEISHSGAMIAAWLHGFFNGLGWSGPGFSMWLMTSMLETKALSADTGAAAWYWSALVFLGLSFAYLGVARPAQNKYRGRRHMLSYLGIVPLVIGAMAFTAAWARHARPAGGATPMPWRELFLIGLMPFFSALVYGIRFAASSAASRRETLFAQLRGLLTPGRRVRVELAALAIASSITVALLALILTFVFPTPWEEIKFDTFPSPIMAFNERAPVASLYVVFAVPLMLGVFFICGGIFVGMSSQVNQDYDREWWARCSGLTFAAIVGWLLLTSIVIFGPMLIHFAPILAATVGGASGIASYVLGRYRAAAEKKKAGSSGAIGTAQSLVAPVFAFALLAFLSLGTSRIFAPPPKVTERTATVLEHVTWESEQKHDTVKALAMGSQFAAQPMPLSARPRVPLFTEGGEVEVKTATTPRPLISAERLAAWNHLRSLEATSFGSVTLLFIALMTVTAFSSRFVNANKFSMHSMYRNRLIRAYLGASRLQRDPNPVTGFDPQDDLPMHFLRPEFLWVASFRDVRAFFDLLDTGTTPFIARLRREVYANGKEKDLQRDRSRDDFAAELAQCINHVIETVDLRAEPLPPVMMAAELAAAFRTQFASDVKWLWSNVRNLRWTKRPRPARTTTSLAKQYLAERWRAVERDVVLRVRSVTGDRIFPVAPADAPRPRPSFAVLRRNRKDLDAAFDKALYPYDQPIVKPTDVRDVDELRRIVRKPETLAAPTTFGEHLYKVLGDDAAILSKLTHTNAHLREAIDVFVRALNGVIERYDLDWENATGFDRIESYPPSSKVFRKNRYILDRNLAGAIHPLRSPRPMHVVNMALNLVRGQNLAWQERKAESFTTSPMHSGSYMLGYRDSSRYGDPSGITLGTAVAISGAAVTPNRGQKTSTPLAFLMTLFNVRLGWWLGNPGMRGQETWTAEGPQPSTQPLIAEASGDTNDRFPYVYLSDGGHFENLGLYEMVLRRRHYIVISDATCDRSYAFDDLGNAIRKIRTDLGIAIDIDKMYIYPRGAEKLGKYCAIGKIRYSRVDANGRDGLLLYIKPGVYMNEPRDVYNYSKTNDEFPHETTIDQWFGESQFESYRMLGTHILDQICLGSTGMAPDDDPRVVAARNWCAKSMEEFFDRAMEYLGDKQPEALPQPPRLKTKKRERERERLDTAVSLLTGKFLQVFDKEGGKPLPPTG